MTPDEFDRAARREAARVMIPGSIHVREPVQNPRPLSALTGDEREAVRLAGQLYTHIADRVCGDGPTREDDLAEVRTAIHVVQHAVMAQAAARLYPGEFRLMGEVIAGDRERSAT